jgi:hypothetical protein
MTRPLTLFIPRLGFYTTINPAEFGRNNMTVIIRKKSDRYKQDSRET